MLRMMVMRVRVDIDYLEKRASIGQTYVRDSEYQVKTEAFVSLRYKGK